MASDAVTKDTTSDAPLGDVPSDTAPALTWLPVAAGAECDIAAADLTKAAAPPPVWTECAPGCLVTSGPAHGFSQMYQGNSSAGIVEGRIVLRRTLGEGVIGGPNRQEVLRIDDGVSLALVEQRGTGCAVPGAAPATPLALAYWRPGKLLLGTFSVGGGPPNFGPAWTPITSLPVTMFSLKDGIGWGFKDGTVRYAGTSTASLVTIDTSPAPPSRAFGHDGFVVWPVRGAGSSQIRGYRPGGTTETYAIEADVIVSAALSKERLCWIRGRGPDAELGKFDAAELRVSTRPASPGDVAATSSPALPAQFGLSDLQVGGDFAATIGQPADNSTSKLIVVQLSTMKMWTLKGRTMDWLNAVFAVSADGGEILVGATDAPGTYGNEVRRLYRLKTSALTDLAKGW